ncbi:MAG: FtsH protease activity modulator HflK [Endozoicomonas sp.]|uniref:FtsH protease activity modulator HflK n=1 Tax=Endozoicomonas sp. TaxID=1892382 RepID=UPI003D9BF3AC
MAWNEPGGNSQDPWGSGNNKGGGKNQGPPDLDEAFRKLQDKLNSMFGGGKSGGNSGGGSSDSGGSSSGMFIGIIVLAIVAYLWNAVYTVDEKDRAVILRFGVYTETVGPGLHMYFPPIESKYQEKVTELRTYNLRQHMLTEDENIVEVSMSVQYNIDDVKKYVLNVAKPLMSLEQATQSALRHVVGSSEMYQVLTQGREIMGQEVRKRLQDYQDNYGTGLRIGKVNIESAQPPKEVQAAFDDVIRAREDEQRAKNKAEAYANKIIPEARGKAQRTIEEANAYRDEAIARAEGESQRFIKLLTEYHRAPDVTRERLYIETVQSVLSNTSKVLVDVKGGNNMMYLPLDRLTQGKSSMPSGQSAELNSQDLTDISNRVAEELNKRVNSARSSGRIGR